MKAKLYTTLCAGMVCVASLANAEVICTEGQNGKEPICVNIGGGDTPLEPIVVKPGKGCGTNSDCGGNLRVTPRELKQYERKDQLEDTLKDVQRSMPSGIQR